MNLRLKSLIDFSSEALQSCSHHYNAVNCNGGQRLCQSPHPPNFNYVNVSTRNSQSKMHKVLQQLQTAGTTPDTTLNFTSAAFHRFSYSDQRLLQVLGFLLQKYTLGSSHPKSTVFQDLPCPLLSDFLHFATKNLLLKRRKSETKGHGRFWDIADLAWTDPV